MMWAAGSHLRARGRSGRLKNDLPGAGLEPVTQPVPRPAGEQTDTRCRPTCRRLDRGGGRPQEQVPGTWPQASAFCWGPGRAQTGRPPCLWWDPNALPIQGSHGHETWQGSAWEKFWT